MKTSKLKSIILLFVICQTNLIFPQVKLPKLISDGMILQRDVEVKVWGWASANENIEINFLDKNFKTVADENGNWEIVIPKQQAGGPYELKISAKNSILVKDILFGDVWVCSGQSNMEFPMKRVSWNYPGEIENSENNFIREFAVPQKYNFKVAEKDFSHGSWKSANLENIPNFSAVAYFFAKKIYEKYKIPVGIINASLGGSRIESWMSEDALQKFPHHLNEALMFRDDNLIKKIEDSDIARSNAWYNLLRQKDEGYKDQKNIWYKTNLEISDWKKMNVPGYWADTEIGKVNGVVWFKKNVNIPLELVGKYAKLILGRIVDADSVFVNGKYVGSVGYQYPPRRYEIPKDILNAGENEITIRVISNAGMGGFVLDKDYEIEFDNTSISLEGEWNYKLGAIMPELGSQTFIRWKPMGLYNSMISPLHNYKIKGFAWYQGESNTWNPSEYSNLLSTMISDWRTKWSNNNLPFIVIQLPNFMEEKNEPSESSWAAFREVQLDALKIPNTGLVVTIDLGEWNDIHPLNKKDVGERLFQSAEKIAYKNNSVINSGPIYKSMKIEGNKIILTFDNIGDRLISKNHEELKEFAICGNDKKFIWAHAKIENDKVIVWNDNIKNPVAVRYAWADNPSKANLYNSAGLPASPFRTDKY
ncbi:MAG: sialate O-acetylesterase [Ignavibacteriae bacterium]|nr:sialate O-acetylesterase [Ignavibacteriota bacterium]